MNSVEIGDLVEADSGEQGVMCSMDPPVMRTLRIVSYVPIHSYSLKVKGYDTSCTISDAVLGRIRDYQCKQNTCPELKTGD